MISRSKIIASAFFATYVLWGTSYVATRFLLQRLSIDELVGFRGFLGGVALLGIAFALREQRATRAQILNSILLGIATVGVGTMTLVMGLQFIDAGVSATIFSLVPIVVGVLDAARGRFLAPRQWVGFLISAVGIALLTYSHRLGGPQAGRGIFLTFLAVCIYALTAVWNTWLDLPASHLANAGIQSLSGGTLMLAAALVLPRHAATGLDRLTLLLLLYLALGVTVCGYLGYLYLIDTVGPALASTYAFMNPVVALAGGALFLGERMTLRGAVACVIIILGGCVAFTPRGSSARRVPERAGGAV